MFLNQFSCLDIFDHRVYVSLHFFFNAGFDNCVHIPMLNNSGHVAKGEWNETPQSLMRRIVMSWCQCGAEWNATAPYVKRDHDPTACFALYISEE